LSFGTGGREKLTGASKGQGGGGKPHCQTYRKTSIVGDQDGLNENLDPIIEVEAQEKKKRYSVASFP